MAVAETLNYDALDPGIRDIVRRVREAGFETTDSGDGVSKSAELYAGGDALPFPHVVFRSCPETFFRDAHRVADVLGDEWVVEMTYSTADCHCVGMGRPRG